MTAESPNFSVIIPTSGRPDLLRRCLSKLSHEIQNVGGHYEVIVSDDSGQTETKEFLEREFPWVRWHRGPGRGPAANRNSGASVASGVWLVFTDDDCIPSGEWLSAYETAIAAYPSISVFEGRVFVDRPRQSLAEVAPANEQGGYLWSCNMAVKRPLFVELGGFDERFPFAAMEDVEFRHRLKKKKLLFPFVVEAAVCHPWRMRRGWRELQQHAHSTLIFLSIHPEARTSINAPYYLKMVVRDFLKRTIPLAISFRGRGVGHAILEHVAYLKMALLLTLGVRG